MLNGSNGETLAWAAALESEGKFFTNGINLSYSLLFGSSMRERILIDSSYPLNLAFQFCPQMRADPTKVDSHRTAFCNKQHNPREKKIPLPSILRRGNIQKEYSRTENNTYTRQSSRANLVHQSILKTQR